VTKKIIEEMRERYSKDPLGYAKANEWADALEAEMREPVAERVLTERGLEWEWYWQDPPVGTKLYTFPPDAAAVIEQLREDAEAGNAWEQQLLGCDRELTEAYEEIKRFTTALREIQCACIAPRPGVLDAVREIACAALAGKGGRS
jgi:hypothetical protein